MERVKPLKIENTSNGGGQTDLFPTEINPVEDYLSAKGVAFEGLDTFLTHKIGRTIVEQFPTLYQEVIYASNVPSSVNFYNSNSFITANRIARYDFTFTGDNLTAEALKIYDTDGSTILKTYTWTHSYSGSDYVSSGLVIT